jgi:seryl-tRNA synthetase
MLSISLIKNNKDKVINSLIKRNFKNIKIIDDILYLYQQKNIIKSNLELINFKINKISKQISQVVKHKPIKDKVYINKSLRLKFKKKKLINELSNISNKIYDLIITVPNIIEEHYCDKLKNIEYGFNDNLNNKNNLLPHWELGKKFNIINLELGSKITGSGFSVFIGQGAKLHRSLIKYFLDENIKAGYLEYDLPYLVNKISVFSSGHIPDKQSIMYSINNNDYYLIPTSEVTLLNCFRDNLLFNKDLPIKMTTYSPCFRRESGSYGVNVRGLNRLHQFNKVEIVQITNKYDSFIELKNMIKHVKYILKSLSLPFRIIRVLDSDLGFTSAITYDFEVYSYAQKKWLEVSSISNCLDFQSMRLNLKYRDRVENKINYCHTLNGSSLALPRILVALLENNQKDSCIKIPKVLIPYVGFSRIE